MIKQDFLIANIIARYMSGEITPTESLQLRNWRNENPDHEILFQKICSEENLKQHIEESMAFNITTAWEKVQERIKRNNNKEKRIKKFTYAAAILFPILIIGITLSTDYYLHSQPALTTQSISPGKAKAILTLNNGKAINIDKNAINTIQKFSKVNIQIDSTTLNYQNIQTISHKKAKATYNKVEIPRGGEYTLVLSDGTKVHLNSMSSLRFPVTFTTDKREVELKGEAYFEVSKTGQPFIVNTQNVQVEVLGTIFNISAYPNEECQTTLVKGSVKINAIKGGSSILRPSQQATISLTNNAIQICTVNTSFYTSWTRGKINFKDERLEDIMKILSRWYDIDVIYRDKQIKDIRFGCNLDRYKEITPFIKLLEKTQKIHTKISGKTITFYRF